MKIYRGSATPARDYVEAGRSRADDYYLAEGPGVSERFAATPTAGVRHLDTLTGDTYEAWVAGYDPVTGAAKGRLRHDDQAVRFVEVIVNGPKSWSLAAALNHEIAAAYDAAQDRAAEQIISWLAEHVTTRVGPRGAQMQVAVQEIEAVTVRHQTSRAGDRTVICTCRSMPGFRPRTAGADCTRSACAITSTRSTESATRP